MFDIMVDTVGSTKLSKTFSGPERVYKLVEEIVLFTRKRQLSVCFEIETQAKAIEWKTDEEMYSVSEMALV